MTVYGYRTRKPEVDYCATVTLIFIGANINTFKRITKTDEI